MFLFGYFLKGKDEDDMRESGYWVQGKGGETFTEGGMPWRWGGD